MKPATMIISRIAKIATMPVFPLLSDSAIGVLLTYESADRVPAYSSKLRGRASRDERGNCRSRSRRRAFWIESLRPILNAALPVRAFAHRTGHVVRNRVEHQVVERDEHDLRRAEREVGRRRNHH